MKNLRGVMNRAAGALLLQLDTHGTCKLGASISGWLPLHYPKPWVSDLGAQTPCLARAVAAKPNVRAETIPGFSRRVRSSRDGL